MNRVSDCIEMYVIIVDKSSIYTEENAVKF